MFLPEGLITATRQNAAQVLPIYSLSDLICVFVVLAIGELTVCDWGRLTAGVSKTLSCSWSWAGRRLRSRLRSFIAFNRVKRCVNAILTRQQIFLSGNGSRGSAAGRSQVGEWLLTAVG